MKVNTEILMNSADNKDNKAIIKVDIKGSFDNNNTFKLEFFIYALINGGVKKILIDIEDLQYIDSTGIGSLIAIAKRIKKGKRRNCYNKIYRPDNDYTKTNKYGKIYSIFSDN